MDIALQLAEIYGGGLNPQAQAMQPAAANDVQKFQQFMSTPASQDYSIENLTPTAHTGVDRAAESIRQTTSDFVNKISADRREILAMNKDLISKIGSENFDGADIRTQVAMLHYTTKMQNSSTELTFMTSVGQSVDKNIKMLFQTQA
jgi:tRNA C32,U32 (ribose-2'-O)-methylase TrmJ